MTEPQTTNIRMERIEKLLRELEYEVTRGMMDREIDEFLHFRFIVPVSQKIIDGAVVCEFRTRPNSMYEISCQDIYKEPKLRIVK